MRPDTIELQPGHAIDRYELLLPIAMGGMSQIWAARLRGTRGFEKLVALKALAVSGSGVLEAERLFWQEARVASQIQHPNVAQCFDLIEHAGVLCLTMEWIDGESLSTLLRQAARVGGVPLNIAVQIIVQACKGLHAAHELCDSSGQRLELVHCDVSPANLMISSSGIVKLVDFGIAKLLRQSTGPDQMVGGKPSFMAREQAMGQRVDRRTDIFSLGIVLYLLTTGRHPFAASKPAETLLAICNGRAVVPPSQVCVDYPPALEWVVMTALAHEPDLRFQSVAEMLEELVAAYPNVATESELAQFLKLTCELSLGDRRAKVNEALLRAAVPLVPASEVDVTAEPTPGSLSPALLDVYPAPEVVAQRSLRRRKITAGALLLASACAWLLAAPSANDLSSARPAAPSELVSPPRSLPAARATAPVSEAPSPADDPSSAETPVLPQSDGAKEPLAPSPKKRKTVSIGLRYGI